MASDPNHLPSEPTAASTPPSASTPAAASTSPAPAPDTGAADTAATAPRRGLRAGRVLGWTAATLLVAIGVVLGGAWWLSATEQGLRTLLSTIARVTGGTVVAEGVQGALIGPLRIDALRVRTATLDAQVRQLALDWDWRALWQRRLSVQALSVADLRIVTTPSNEPDKPAELPAHLRLPLAVRVEQLSVDTLRIGAGDEPLTLRGLGARIESDATGTHRLDALRARTPWGDVAGAVSVGATAPFALQAQASFDGSLPATPTPPTPPAPPASDTGATRRAAPSTGAQPEPPPAAGRSLHAQAAVDGTLERFVLSLDTTGALAGQVRATLQPFAPVPIGQTELSLRGVDPAQWRPGLPHAALTLTARLVPTAPGPTPQGDWKHWTVEGPIELTNDAPGTLDTQRLPVQRVSTVARWRAERLSLDALRIELPRGAALAGDAHWTAQPSPGSFELALRATNVDAQALHRSLQATRLSGRLQASGDASQQALRVALTEPRFALDADASHGGGRVSVRSAKLGARDALLEVRGDVELGGARQFSVDGRLAGFDPKVYIASAPRARLNATLSARGTLPEQAAGLRAQLRFALGNDSRLDGRPLSGQGRIELVEQRIADADVDLNLAGNRVFARGAFGRRGDALALRVDAPRLADLGFGLGGSLQADAQLAGSLQSPTGRLNANASRLSLPGGQRIGRLQADAALDQGPDGPLAASISVSELRSASDAAPLLAQASAELRGTLRAHALQASARGTAAGDVALRVRGGLSRIEPAPVASRTPAAPTPPAAGAAGSPGVELIGEFADGSAQWRGTIERLELTGRESLRLAEPAALTARRDAVRLERVAIESNRGRATVAEFGWSPQLITSRGRFDDVALPPELLRAAEGVRSTLRLAGQWDLRIGDTLAGTVRVARQQGDVTLRGLGSGGAATDTELALGLSALQLELQAAGERLSATARMQGARTGTLAGQGSVQLVRTDGQWGIARDGAITATLELAVPNLDWVGPVLNPEVRTAGSLNAQLRVSGPAREPVVAGSLAADRLRVRLLEQGVDLADGRVRLTIDESLLTLREAVFTAPIRQRPADPRLNVTDAAASTPGTVRAEGSIRIAGAGAGQGAIHVQADRIAALQTRERWLMASGTAALTLGADQLTLAGDLRADAGSIDIGDESRPQLGNDVVVIRRSDKQKAAANQKSGSPLALDLSVALGDKFFVRGRGLDARLAGSLRVRGQAGKTLLATGFVRTVDGTFNAYNQRLAIERGVVNFQGPIENPGLNIRAVRRNLRVVPGVEITGTVQQPRIKLVSEPELPESEKLSWLVLGYPPSQLSGREQELLGSAALALLSGQRSGGGGSDLLRSLGVDISLRSGPSAAPGSATLAQLAAASPGAGTPATAQRIVTVGRRLSDKAYLGVEQSLTGTLTIVQLTYQMSRRLSAVARTGAENALDLIYTFSFR